MNIKIFRHFDFIEGGTPSWSRNGVRPATADDRFGEPPYETPDYNYEVGPLGEGEGAGNDGSFTTGDKDDEPIFHSKN